MAKTLIKAAWTLFVSISTVWAQVPRDPTKPAPGFGPAGEAEVVSFSSAQGYVLQSVIRRHGVKPVGMINGKMVRVGEKIDEYVLVKLTETEATLKGEAGKEILVMSPSVEKKNLRQGPAGR